MSNEQRTEQQQFHVALSPAVQLQHPKFAEAHVADGSQDGGHVGPNVLLVVWTLIQIRGDLIVLEGLLDLIHRLHQKQICLGCRWQ